MDFQRFNQLSHLLLNDQFVLSYSGYVSEDILRASRDGGLDLRMHIDEFADGGGGELAAELRVRTADHAHHTTSDTRQKMNAAGVMTGFLPGTPYCNGDA